MRTVIFVGFLMLGDAVRGMTGGVYEPETVKLIAFIFVASMIMDVVDFLRNKKTT